MASRIINMTIPENLIKEVDEVARREGRTRSDLFREAARMYIRGTRPSSKNSSRLLSRLAALATKGPNLNASDLDGLLYAKENKH